MPGLVDIVYPRCGEARRCGEDGGFVHDALEEDDMSRFLLVLCVVCSGCQLEDEPGQPFGGGDLPPAGRIQVAPNPLIFPPTALGESSTLTFQVANTGDEALRVEGVELVEGGEDGAGEIVAGQVWTPRFDIAKGGAPQAMTLEWRPVNEVADTAMLRFKVVGAANVPGGVYEVSVSTPRIAPSLKAPAELSFSEVPMGETRREVIYLQNDGSAALHISALVLEPQAEFSLRFPDPEAADVEAAAESDRHKEVLRPGERIPVRVSFTPSGLEPASATITITSDSADGAEHRIALSGEAADGCVRLSASPNADTASDATHRVDLGVRPIGGLVEVPISVQNCSRARPLAVGDVRLVDDAGGAFELVQALLPLPLQMGGTMTLEAGASAPLMVTFVPGDALVKRGRLVLSTNVPGSEELRVELEAQGAPNQCPEAVALGVVVGGPDSPASRVETEVLKTVKLLSANSHDMDGRIEQYEWNLISKPQDSIARLVPSNRVIEPHLSLDQSGTYEVELTVTDDLGLQSCEVAKVTIIAL
jgi:hypothetical protein